MYIPITTACNNNNNTNKNAAPGAVAMYMIYELDTLQLALTTVFEAKDAAVKTDGKSTFCGLD